MVFAFRIISQDAALTDYSSTHLQALTKPDSSGIICYE